MSYVPPKNAKYFATSSASLRPALNPPRFPKWPFKIPQEPGRVPTPTSAVMLDLETLDNISTAVVAELAVIWFNPQSTPSSIFNEKKEVTTPHLDMFIDYSEAAQPGRTRSASTIDWWNEQDQGVIDRVFGPDVDRVTLAEALEKFEQFCYDHEVQAVYCHPPRFDMAIMNSAFSTALGREFSIPFFNEVDSKSLEQFVFGKNTRKAGGPFAFGDKHLALDDTVAQACMVQFCYHHRHRMSVAAAAAAIPE